MTWIVLLLWLVVCLFVGILIVVLCLVGRCSLLVVSFWSVWCCNRVVVVWCIRSVGIVWLLRLGIIVQLIHCSWCSTILGMLVSIVWWCCFSSWCCLVLLVRIFRGILLWCVVLVFRSIVCFVCMWFVWMVMSFFLWKIFLVSCYLFLFFLFLFFWVGECIWLVIVDVILSCCLSKHVLITSTLFYLHSLVVLLDIIVFKCRCYN